MPGGIATNLQRHMDPEYMERARREPSVRLKSVEQGAATSVLLATSPLLEGVGGRYFDDCNEAKVLRERLGRALNGVAPYALDPANAERLWEVSEALLRP